MPNPTTPDRSTAAAFPRYLTGEVVADSVALRWPELYARRLRHPRVVDRFLVPATPEAHISCKLRGVAEFRERDVGGAWITRQIRAGDLFVTRSVTPYEVRFQSPPGEELETLSLHIAVEPFLAALEASLSFLPHTSWKNTQTQPRKCRSIATGCPFTNSARSRIM